MGVEEMGDRDRYGHGHVEFGVRILINGGGFAFS